MRRVSWSYRSKQTDEKINQQKHTLRASLCTDFMWTFVLHVFSFLQNLLLELSFPVTSRTVALCVGVGNSGRAPSSGVNDSFWSKTLTTKGAFSNSNKRIGNMRMSAAYAWDPCSLPLLCAGHRWDHLNRLCTQPCIHSTCRPSDKKSWSFWFNVLTLLQLVGHARTSHMSLKADVFEILTQRWRTARNFFRENAHSISNITMVLLYCFWRSWAPWKALDERNKRSPNSPRALLTT